MLRGLLTVVTLALAITMSGCMSFGPVLRGSGVAASETRDVGRFTRISVGGSGELVVIQGAETSLVVEADDNLLPYLETVVEGDTLRLGISDAARGRSVQPRRTIRYTVTTPNVEELRGAGSTGIRADALDLDRLELNVSGSANVVIGTLVADEITVDISGSGNVDVAGRVDTQRINVGGSGNYRAADLESARVSAQSQGSGRVTVWVTESLDARASGAGDVRYYGSPQTSASTSGSGRVTPLGER
jgi:hypothetical protein